MVGQIGDELELFAGSGGERCPQAVEHLGVEPVLGGEGVAMQYAYIGKPGDRFGREFCHRRIDVNRDHDRATGGHERGQRARARPDFQNDVVGTHPGRFDDQVMNVQVDQKILTQPALG